MACVERGSASDGALEMRVAEPCKEALQVWRDFCSILMCHSTLNTCMALPIYYVT